MEKAKIFLLGMLAAMCLFFLVGAGGGDGEVGRFQPVPIVSTNAGLFIIDTKTGVTKIVWGAWKGGQLGKSFADMALQPPNTP